MGYKSLTKTFDCIDNLAISNDYDYLNIQLCQIHDIDEEEQKFIESVAENFCNKNKITYGTPMIFNIKDVYNFRGYLTPIKSMNLVNTPLTKLKI